MKTQEEEADIFTIDFFRMIDPHVDIVRAEWSPFRQPSWMMPLLTELSDWRQRLDQIQTSLSDDADIGVVFVADFPGTSLRRVGLLHIFE